MNDAIHSVPSDNPKSGRSSNSDAASDAPGNPSGKKVRSKTERNIVWGAIAVLLVVMGLELRAHLGFTKAYNTLSAAMEADGEEAEEQHILTEGDVVSQMNGVAPVQSERLNYLDALASRVDTYQWRGPLRTRSLHVYYGAGEENPDVVSISLEKDRTTESYFESLQREQKADVSPGADEPAGE
ncbi:MAG: hypothetical protein KF861_18565 [Planctomycetaceae bacterium]|nr:hypothetical protein [Planctomycetaceae bacterium]